MTEIRLPFSELVERLSAIFVKQGLPGRVASVLATNCATCQRDGALSHGVFRIPAYVSTLQSGWAARPRCPRSTRARAR